MRVLLDDTHLVAPLADKEMRPFALASNVPMCKPEAKMIAAPDAAKIALLNDINDGTSKEMLDVELLLNSK